jgi:hypothetical protein
LLGPSVIFFSPTFSTAYAYRSCAQADPVWPARIGLVLAGAELLVLAAFMIVGALDATAK